MNKYKFAKRWSIWLNIVILVLVKHFLGMEIALLVGIATIISTLDEFGYYFMEHN